ncbi:MAG: S41 family peptidase [Pyrinomonadaceae bacterium]
MLDRIASAALVLAAAASVYSQPGTVRTVGQNRSDDPFSLSAGRTFSASSGKTARPARPSQPLASSITTDILDAIAVIRQNHVAGRSLDQNELTKASVNAMLKVLDPHSNFYDAAEYDELIGDQKSEYFGTGSTIASYERNGEIGTYIMWTFPGSASERAGLRFGDKLRSINGVAVDARSSLAVRDMIRGPRGTSVRVVVERDGRDLAVDIKRERIPQPTVTNAFIIGDGVGLIEMPEGFSFTSYSEFDTAFAALKRAGMTSLILDLRGNPGGVLEQSIKIAEKFLPAGATIVSQKGRFPLDSRVWRSNNRAAERLPLIVLVDGESASASEVIAGALQDNDRALIVGEKTFGKGLVQSVLDLPAGTGLTLTTAKYFTPSGRSIQRDYERSGMYDYYNHKESSNGTQESKVAAYTVTKRQVFGGDGITPDQFAPTEQATAARVAMLDPIFFYTLEHQGHSAEIIGDETVKEFARFALSGWGIGNEAVMANAEFVKERLKYNLSLARSGPKAAREMLLRDDRQVRTAISAIPKAAAFIKTPRKADLSIK